jgi:hypothetical protein
LLNQPEAEKVEWVIRRRRTSRHRRNRKIRRVLLAVFCLGLAIGVAGVVLPYLSPSLFRASQSIAPSTQAVESDHSVLQLSDQESLPAIENRPIYPYSVVPGGVRDVSELKWAADHDPVVGAHYAGFDYDNARVVVLKATLSAYVSYRIGNKVYWMRRRISLKKGETVITDGKMIARTRCANRVEEVPQQQTSSSEPPATKFDEPVHPSTGTAFASPPAPFQSALLNRPSLPGLGPAPPLSLYDPFSPGTWIPISPPPLPSICGVGKKPTTVAGVTKKRNGDPCGNGGSSGEVPEPGTWLLFGTGLAAIYWKTRQRFVRSSPE